MTELNPPQKHPVAPMHFFPSSKPKSRSILHENPSCKKKKNKPQSLKKGISTSYHETFPPGGMGV